MQPDILRTVSVLKDLTDEEMELFAGLLTPYEAEPGYKILAEGAEVTALYIVCGGVVHVRRLAQTREMLLGRMGVGAFFGEINLFDPGVATASVYAMNTVLLGVISYEQMRLFMHTNPAAGYKIVSSMMTEMSKRLRQTSARLVNTVYWSGNEANVPGQSS